MYHNRIHAGQELAQHLIAFKNDPNTIVIAIPRGGIVPARIIADYLDIPLDVCLVKKIGHPRNKECAIGAVSLETLELYDADGVSDTYIEQETQLIRSTLEAKYASYFSGRKPLPLQGKKVIVVDDGLATGSTMFLTIKTLRKMSPKAIIVAVPVGPPSVVEQVKKLADVVICLEQPIYFNAVGEHYEQFGQVTDSEVIEILKKYH